jgi:hypothetical protein
LTPITYGATNAAATLSEREVVMADGAVTSLKSRVSEAEWKARVDLAALYRLVALHGWDDMIFTHISARVPGRSITS